MDSHGFDRNAVIAAAHYKYCVLRRAWGVLERNLLVAKRSRQLSALRFWAFHTQQKSFLRLKQWTSHQQSRRNQTRTALNHWALQTKRHFFARLTLATKHARIRILKARKLQGVAVHKRNKELASRCFKAWESFALHHWMRAKQFAERNLLLKTFHTWTQYTARRRLQRMRKRRATALANEKILLSTLLAWRELPRPRVQAKKEEHVARIQRFQAVRPLQFAMKKLKQEWKRQMRYKTCTLLSTYFRWMVLVKGTFNVWKQKATKRLQVLSSRKAAQAMERKRRLRKGFLFLQQIVEDRKEARANKVLALQHWAKTIQRRTWRAWVVWRRISRAKQDRVRQGEMFFRRKCLDHAMQAFVLHVQVSKRRRHEFQQADSHFMSKRARLAIRQLAGNATLTSQNRKRIHAASAIFHTSLLRRTVSAWKRATDVSKRELDELDGLADMFYRTKITKRAKSRALAAIREKAASRGVSRSRISLAVEHSRRLLLSRSLHQMHEWTSKTKVKHLLTLSAVTHSLRSCLKKAFKGWLEYHHLVQQLVGEYRKAERHRGFVLVSQCFASMKVYFARRQEKKKLAENAITWRRGHLLRCGVTAWLQNALREKASLAEAVQAREAKKAAKLAKRVAAIAFHWRDLTLRRKLETREGQRTVHTEKTFRIMPRVERVQLDRPLWETRNKKGTVEARTQIRSLLNLDWLDRLEPSPEARPPPRRPVDLFLDDEEQHTQPPHLSHSSLENHRFTQSLGAAFPPFARESMRSQRVAESQTSLSGRSFRPRLVSSSTQSHFTDDMGGLEADSRVQGMSEAQLRGMLLEFSGLRRQVLEDKHHRDRIRKELRRMRKNGELDENAIVPESVKHIVDDLTCIQERKARFDSLRAQVLPLLKEFLQQQESR